MKKQLFLCIIISLSIFSLSTITAFRLQDALGSVKKTLGIEPSVSESTEQHKLSDEERRQRRIAFWSGVIDCFKSKGEDSWQVRRARKYLHRAETGEHHKSHKPHKSHKSDKTPVSHKTYQSSDTHESDKKHEKKHEKKAKAKHTKKKHKKEKSNKKSESAHKKRNKKRGHKKKEAKETKK